MNFLPPGNMFPITPSSLDTISPSWSGEASYNNQAMSISLPGDPFNMLSILSPGNHLSPVVSGEVVDRSNPTSFTPPIRAEFESDLSSNPNGDPGQLSAIECGTRLSILRMQLSLHLQQCLEETSDFWDEDMDAKEQQQTAARNPFGEALCYTSELLSIIRCFVQQQALSDVSLSSSAPVFRTINLVTTLDILSAHTQIVSIYDGLFQRLYAKLPNTVGQEAPKLSAPRLQTLPGLQLAGFSVLQGNLQTKILMQAIMHQFETLEKELSLPAELRISKRAEMYPSGLIGRDARTRHVVDSFFASSAQYAGEHIINLRATIDQLKRVLDI